MFLVVREIMLESGDDTSGLYAIDVRACKLAGDIGVFGQGLEASATQGRSLDAYGGT
jgi:hypothetical protein